MKQFITHLAKLLLFIILSHSFIVFITLAISKNINTTSHILAKDILNEGDKIYIMGNSHSECAINDSLLADNYINISLSAEPLFYSVIKARRLLTENKKIDTIIIEFTNNSINTVGWESIMIDYLQTIIIILQKWILQSTIFFIQTI